MAGGHEDRRTRGHEGRREAALGVFFVLGSLFLRRSQGGDGIAARWKRLAVSGWEYREAAAENRRSIEVRMSVRERTAGGSRPYQARLSREGAGEVGACGPRARGPERLSWVGRVAPNPPLGEERKCESIEYRRRATCVRPRTDGWGQPSLPSDGIAVEGTRGQGA